MNYPITNCRQIEEDRYLDVLEYIEQHWEEIEAEWNEDEE